MKKLGFVVLVTKQTQAKEGLSYTLEARRVSPEAVLVSMEIPREGKLKDVRSVSLHIRQRVPPPPGVGQSPEVSAPLQTTLGKNGAWSVAFQLTPELADRCSVDLNVPQSLRGYLIYAVQLKGYVENAS